MLRLETPADLAAHAGTLLGRSDWLAIEQSMVDAFAALSGDRHWIHLDVERAARELPDGRTIAHGLLLLSLIPALQQRIYLIDRRGVGLNYGYDRVRFVTPVPVGSRVRLALALIAVEPHPQGSRIVTEATLELQAADRPALVARNILLIRDAGK